MPIRHGRAIVLAVLALLCIWPDPQPAVGQSADGTAQGLIPVPAYRKANTIGLIRIEGDIDGVTVRSVERRLKAAKDLGAEAVVLELNTFGGDAVATMNLCEIIAQSPVSLTVAWVNPKAFSAGTFMALACREIVMAPRATMGDAAPIMPLTNMAPTERAKFESPLLAEVVDSARRRGYDENLVQAFVTREIEVWLVENRSTGERIFVDRHDFEIIFGTDPPETISGRTELNTPKRVRSFWLGEFGKKIETAGDSITEEERRAAVASQQIIDPPRPPLSEADRGKYVLVRPIDGDNTLLTVKTEEAMEYGLAKAQIADLTEMQAYFGASRVIVMDDSWSESLVRLLTSLPIRGLLLVLCLVGLIWEMAVPGSVLPGLVGFVSLVLLLGAPFMAGLAGWWDILFVLLGIALLAAEIFLLPGFGIAGLAGFVFIAIGFIGTFVAPDPGGGFLPRSPDSIRAAVNGAMTLGLAGVVAGFGCYLVVRHFGTIPGLNRLVLTTQTGDLSDRADAASISSVESMAMQTGTPPLGVGDQGLTLTQLRPVGKADFGGQILEVSAGHGAIGAGTRVRVTSVSALKIVVESMDDQHL